MSYLGKILLSFGALITISLGLWHFFVPKLYNWYQYIKEDAQELVLAIRATNFFFSLCMCLFGLLVLLFIWTEDVDTFNIKMIVHALAILWFCRVIMQIIYPQGSENAYLQIGLLILFTITFALFIFGIYDIYLNRS